MPPACRLRSPPPLAASLSLLTARTPSAAVVRAFPFLFSQLYLSQLYPPLAFVFVTMATTGVLLVGWRAAAAAAAPKKDTSVRGRTSRKARQAPAPIALAPTALPATRRPAARRESPYFACAPVGVRLFLTPVSPDLWVLLPSLLQGNPFEFLQLLAGLTKRW